MVTSVPTVTERKKGCTPPQQPCTTYTATSAACATTQKGKQAGTLVSSAEKQWHTRTTQQTSNSDNSEKPSAWISHSRAHQGHIKTTPRQWSQPRLGRKNQRASTPWREASAFPWAEFSAIKEPRLPQQNRLSAMRLRQWGRVGGHFRPPPSRPKLPTAAKPTSRSSWQW